jgi:ferredoxin
VTARLLDRAGFDALFGVLVELGYTPIGPTVLDGTIRYDRVDSTADLPGGWHDVQDGGTYRLEPRADDALFGFAVGPDSWKRYLFPPETVLLEVRGSDGSLVMEAASDHNERFAFIGVRPCEIAAIETQDRLLLGFDPTYTERRRNALVIAANCTEPGGTCFCASMGTGPGREDGFDLGFTELLDAERHEYLFAVGTDRGADILDRVPGRDATPSDHEQARAAIAAAVDRMGRTLDTEGIRDLLVENPEHPRWADVAERCLACANCTMACPTCFCTGTVDTVGFDGVAVRSRHWDSCFTLDFSAIHGRPVRQTTRSRYRQWMTHKLATWHDQFHVSGCVGCGRCITWCPVGIDITAEVAAIRRGGEP